MPRRDNDDGDQEDKVATKDLDGRELTSETAVNPWLS
jgi:hypothetical protein